MMPPIPVDACTFEDDNGNVHNINRIGPDPEFAGQFAIKHTSSHSYGGISIEYFCQTLANLPANRPLYYFLLSTYPEYCV